MSDRLKVRLVILILIFLVMGGYYSYVEIAYLFQGRETTGTVTKVTDVTKRRRFGTYTSREVEFAFAESNGTQRSGEDSKGTNWTPPSNGVIEVQYTPGANGRARLAGPVQWIGFVFLAIAVAVILFVAVRLWLEAQEAYRPRKKKKRVRYADD